MASKKPDNEDLKFIMSCLKHFAGEFKPDFDEVAKDVGAASGNAWYELRSFPSASPASSTPLLLQCQPFGGNSIR